MKQEIDHSLSISACPHDCPSTCALEVTHDGKNIFKVKVKKVNTITTKGKLKAFRGTLGRRSNFKKAIVTLQEGQSIDMSAGV